MRGSSLRLTFVKKCLKLNVDLTPKSVDLSSTSASQQTFIAPNVGETTLLDFEFVVSDGAIASAPDTVTVTVIQAGQVTPAILIPILNLILE